MPRTKTGTVRRARHKKIRQLAKGFREHRRTTFKGAKEGVLHAAAYAYKSRRLKKRNMRKLWIMRLNGALRDHQISYSVFIHKLKQANIQLNRKVLSQIAAHDPETFNKIVNIALKTQTP
ncbi:50S ribosomal protein L20 [candidate division CPR3 bacterium 4484_211]|uniref:Large ribosomal subunit protein bL20 n=1 Tax=candidate division CPR3 bacterium 4484_211 TaxID=1968527 RepID=A0A1W9NZ27_UNCC3|nr:MAG: 50S ribosomal protein L20 [candidate division CPR3 bacterium 4484_211]